MPMIETPAEGARDIIEKAPAARSEATAPLRAAPGILSGATGVMPELNKEKAAILIADRDVKTDAATVPPGPFPTNVPLSVPPFIV